ncbi:transcription antitermination factor NusB [Moraxella porci DSM 25326]|uniref:Transcription antitermination protein NusB n=1 Tax=Moraxella porci DSM 25326 TaxID=573983 RepID=A0A1T0CV16_9GAMM|nr:transcription antitermination factor NusB [Moraxella porci]OOS26167.1 transcription antitermination factor NusB [Moraxella porci DSM 25326]
MTDHIIPSDTGYKTSHTAVRKARRFALQGLYEWLLTDYRFSKIDRHLMGGNEPHTIAARTRADNAMHTVHLGYYHELMRQIPEQADQLVLDISSYIDRSFDRLDTIEKAVLLIGAYELKHSLHIPYKVVLDEAMQLNTHFGATDAHKLINAVLDQYAKVVREAEVNADQAKKSAN